MIDVPAFEIDLVRVFAVNGGAEIEGLRQTFLTRVEDDTSSIAPEALTTLLGTPDIDTGYVEVFPVTDVAEMGLTGYLTAALDVQDAAVTRDRGKLDALEGTVMIVLSRAFGGRARNLTPGPALTLIGTYPTEAFVAPGPTPLPDPGGAAMPGPKNAQTGSKRLGSAVIALIVLAALVAAALLLLALAGDTS